MKIAIDAMGGDFAPKHEVLGAIDAVKKDSSIEVVLVGQKDVIQKELDRHEHFDRIHVIHAPEVVTMHDAPMQALKEKKESSLNVSVRLLQEGQVDGFVSAGNTGAVLAASIFTLGRIENVDRPAILAVFPSLRKPLVILDIGANVDCKPRHLLQFAKMGSVFSEKVVNIKNPVVKLLNIGEEEEKGNELTLETYKLLKEAQDINFGGNLEPKNLLDGETDVVVCDGFVGNVVLKLGECVTSTIFTLLKDGMKKNFLATIGGIFMFPLFKALKKKLEYDEFGGTILLGVKKVVIIAHGAASPKAIRNAIFEARNVVNQQVVGKIEDMLASEKTPKKKGKK